MAYITSSIGARRLATLRGARITQAQSSSHRAALRRITSPGAEACKASNATSMRQGSLLRSIKMDVKDPTRLSSRERVTKPREATLAVTKARAKHGPGLALKIPRTPSREAPRTKPSSRCAQRPRAESRRVGLEWARERWPRAPAIFPR